ncbi:MAG: hypothetical protein Greene071436_124 [Parcubacteria group bacterium Greene0714_36]|nr:MAG: hypothetical protein Greene071436_124 [Parcubacteria group bacterium Greene0714_36]
MRQDKRNTLRKVRRVSGNLMFSCLFIELPNPDFAYFAKPTTMRFVLKDKQIS